MSIKQSVGVLIVLMSPCVKYITDCCVHWNLNTCLCSVLWTMTVAQMGSCLSHMLQYCI